MPIIVPDRDEVIKFMEDYPNLGDSSWASSKEMGELIRILAANFLSLLNTLGIRAMGNKNNYDVVMVMCICFVMGYNLVLNRKDN